jgi:secreted Zn-dependent insulinase-like peptidase
MYYYLLCIRLNLTDKGLQYKDKIITIVYQYINYIKSIDKKIFKQKYHTVNKIAYLNFLYKSKEESLDYVVDISQNMQHYDKKYYLIGNTVIFKYKYTDITNVLDEILKQNTLIFIITKSGNIDTSKYKTEYYYKLLMTRFYNFSKKFTRII